MRPQRLDRVEHGRKRRAQQRPVLRRRCRLLLVQRLQDALLELRAEPGERAQLLSLGRLAQLGDGRDAEVLPDPAGGLRAEPGEAHERDHVGRDDGLVLRQRVHLAVLDDLDDLALDRLADPLELLGLAVERELRDRATRLADQCRRAAICEHAEGVVAFDLEDVGEQLELRGDVSIARQRRRHDRDDTEMPLTVVPPQIDDTGRTPSDASVLPRLPRVPVEADRLEPIDRLRDQRRLAAGDPEGA